jgi:hypothetical protein
LVGKFRNLPISFALGELLHGYFENYEADEGLAPDHWFWDREKSGGSFVEHRVQFFICSPVGSGRVRWWTRRRRSDRAEKISIRPPRMALECRPTRIDNRFYITYVCVSRHGAATALTSTDDFVSFGRHGVIF